jgi:hypothetical protein
MKFPLKNKYLQIILLFFVFIFGFILYYRGNGLGLKEKMSDMSLSCPNLLRQEGDMIMLYDLTQPGSTTNPAIFHNLAEYAQFVKEQQAQGIHCPILELQTQIVGASISNLPPTTPSSNETPSEDKIRFYDKYAMEVKMGEFKKEDDVIDPDVVSDNPMDHNWGGIQHSAQSLASGKYDGDMVTKPLYFNIRQNGTSFDPEYPGMPPPPNYVPRDLLAKDITTTK